MLIKKQNQIDESNTAKDVEGSEIMISNIITSSRYNYDGLKRV